MRETPEEKAKRLDVPLIEPLEKEFPMDKDPTVAVCGECGRSIKSSDLYACNRKFCPVQSKIMI